MTTYNVPELVRSAIVVATGVEEHELTDDVALAADLGIESLDLLDLFFRIQCVMPLLLSVERCAQYLQGDVSDEEFSDERGIVRPRGLDRLRTIMPQIDTVADADRLTVDRVLSLLTVGNLVTMVETLLAQSSRPSHV